MAGRSLSLPAMVRHPAAVVVAVLALSCIGDGSGPNIGRPGHFQLAPFFQSAAAGIVPITKIRVLLFRPGSPTPALDTLVKVSPTDSIISLNLTVAVFTSADPFTATLA